MTTERGIEKAAPQEIRVLDQAHELTNLETMFALAVRRRELLAQYIKDRLRPSEHFYTVEGSNKPSLNKDGAEVINLPHGNLPKYDQLAGPTEPPEDKRPYQITVKCRLMTKDERFGGEGLGSASSHITKRDGTYKPRQNDPGLCHNATLKMAQKSAYISATLNATAASEFFTQDMEDAEAGEGAAQKPESGSKTAERGFCPTHQVPFRHLKGVSKKTNKPYDFWACPERGCQERPETPTPKEAARADTPQTPKDSPQPAEPPPAASKAPAARAAGPQPPAEGAPTPDRTPAPTLRHGGDVLTAARKLLGMLPPEVYTRLNIAGIEGITDPDAAFKELQEQREREARAGKGPSA